MPSLLVEGDRVVLRLTGLQSAMSLVRQVSVPLSDITDVRVVADRSELDLGWRVGGTEVPRRLSFGRFRKFRGPRTFAAVYYGRPAVLIETSGGDWDRVAVTVEDPEGAVARLRAAAGLG